MSNWDEFKEEFNKNFNTGEFHRLYPTPGEKIGVFVQAGISLAFLVSASRSAKRGDYGRAIYKAVLWSGFTRNNNASHHLRVVRDVAKQQHECSHELALALAGKHSGRSVGLGVKDSTRRAQGLN